MARNKWIVQIVNGSFLSKELFLKQLPFLLYLLGLMVFYIGYGYYAEKTLRSLVQEGSELKELKSEYTTNFSRLEKMKRQSNLARMIESTGLKESIVPPHKIVVPADE